MEVELWKPDELEIGQEVWAVLGPGKTIRTEVTALHSMVLKDGDAVLVQTYAIRPSHIIFDRYFDGIEEDKIPYRYLARTQEEVEHWAKVIPVEQTEEEWLKAIGRRPTFDEIKAMNTQEADDSLEECELQICCAGISSVRDILLDCKENGGLTIWEVELLEDTMMHSSHDMPEDSPILESILRQMGIKWGGK